MTRSLYQLFLNSPTLAAFIVCGPLQFVLLKWKGPFPSLPTGIFGITSGGGPFILVGIFRSKFAVPFLTSRFFSQIKEFRKGIKSFESHSYCFSWFNRRMSFHFSVISDRSVWHYGKHPKFTCKATVREFHLFCENHSKR